MRENERNWRENEKKRELEALGAKILFNPEESFFFTVYTNGLYSHQNKQNYQIT